MILLKVGDTAFKNPTDFEYQYYNLTKSGRTASGKMTMEIIAQKRKFICNYADMSTQEFETMMSVAFALDPFYTLSVFKDNVWSDYTVYTGDINKKLVRTGNVWYYKDVRIAFIEQ